MNARVYDPTLGRFMSADTIIQDPHDMQTYNRYSYVRNNPLKYTDPSGHSFASVIKALIVAVVVIAVAYVAMTIMGIKGIGYMAMMGNLSLGEAIAIGAISGFTGGYLGALVNGSSPGDALVAGLTGALIGAISAGGARIIGHSMGFAHTDYFQRAIAHGIFRGILAKVQGGNFGNGFMSTFASTLFGKITDGLRYASDAIKATVHALVGGTVSVISGGKFANGAVNAAVVWLFNDIYDNGSSKTVNDSTSEDFRKAHPNSFSVHAHADKNILKLYGVAYYSFIQEDLELINDIFIKDGWNGKQDIILFACNAGKGNINIASVLSKFLKVDIYAPNKFYAVPDNPMGKLFNEQGYITPDNYLQYFHISTGTMKLFKAQ